MWLEIRDNLHTPNATWLAYYGLQILAQKFMEVFHSRVISMY